MQNMRQDADTFDDLRCTILHQTIVGGDIGFTFSGVDDQRFDFVAATLQFIAGRKTSAAQSGDAELVNAGDQGFTTTRTVILPAFTLNPAVFAVGINDHAQLGQC